MVRHGGTLAAGEETMPMSRRVSCLAAALLLCVPALAFAAPEGQLTSGVHFTLAPTLFEPAETPGVVSPFMILYALHDALVKPMPGKSMAPGSSTSSCCARACASTRARPSPPTT
jgi:hypothetical protein